jgi:hypothetical protein
MRFIVHLILLISSYYIKAATSSKFIGVALPTAAKHFNGSQLIITAAIAPDNKKPGSIRRVVAAKSLSAWGVLFVLSLLGNTIKRLIPIALEPLMNKDLNNPQLVTYFLWSAFMVYVEGYKAFHLKFVPLVVRRSLTLIDHPSFLNLLFAGPYSMGLFYSTKKRKIISWSVTAGVFTLVMLVKKLPYPWRGIIDAGVVCGLSFGALSLTIQFLRGIFGYIPDVDPCLPESKSGASTF